MPRSFVALALLVATLLVAPVAVAQEATPAATPEAITGVDVEPLGLVEVLPGLFTPIVRVTLAPGVGLPPTPVRRRSSLKSRAAR
jgi:hypothetical protein